MFISRLCSVLSLFTTLLVTPTLTMATDNTCATPKPKTIKLTYFDIEGAAEATRLALVLSGTEFEDERVKFPEWAALKPTTPYGQLPLLQVDDGPVRTQSGAMLRWVGATLSTTLYPPAMLLDIEEALGVVEDMEKSWHPCLYMGMRPANFGYADGFQTTDQGKALIQKMRSTWAKESLPTFLTHLQGLLQKNNGKWLASSGDNEPTIADCKAVVALRAFTRGNFDHVPTDCLETHPLIIDYIQRFCALEPVKGRYTTGVF